MKLIRTLLVSATAVLLSSGLAFAQSGTGPGGGGGTTITSGSGSGGTTDLDLPLDPTTLDPANYQGPPDDDDDGDTPDDTPPPTIYGEEIDSENDTIFYVLDISGSMGWDSQSYTGIDGSQQNGVRLDRAKAELVRSIMGLADNFEFNVIAFDCGTRQWQSNMVEATDANKQSAMGWIMGLQPVGATGTGPATAAALGDKDNMAVVLLTDGAPNCGASGMGGHRTMIRTANTQGATINVFGIAASGSYRAFCQGVASDSGGSYFDVP